MTLRGKGRSALLIGALLVLLQITLWLLVGREELPAQVFIDDLEASVLYIAANGVPGRSPYQYLILSENISDGLAPEALELCRNALRSSAPTTRVVTSTEWYELIDGMDEKTLLQLGTHSSWESVEPVINLPLFAKVECMSNQTGHSHWYVYLLGHWIQITRSYPWYSGV